MNTVNELFGLVPRCDLAGIQAMIVDEPGRAYAHHGEVRITSCFQPVISLTHGRAVGFEALLRARDAGGKAVAPMMMFELNQEFSEVLLLDRLSCTVHIDNFLKQANAEGWLFVNMNPQVFVESVGPDSFFADLFERYQLPPQRVVVELLEESDTAPALIAEAMQACRAHGCLVAFDDFDANAANFDRLGALRPDIVKINRRLTERAVSDGNTRRELAAAIRTIHDMGSLALLQGVETQEQAELALELQADLVEGYFLGRPEFDIPTALALSDTCSQLSGEFRAHSLSAPNRHRDVMAAYMSGAWAATVLLESDLGLELAVQGVCGLPATLSCYLADAQGKQVGERVFTPAKVFSNPAFAHLVSTAGANYAHQPCFRNAWARPEKIQVSETTFSVMSRVWSVTLSSTVQVGGAPHVLCVELDSGLLES